MGNCFDILSNDNEELTLTDPLHPRPIKKNFQFVFKILMIGDSSVGKSSVLMQHVEKSFSEQNTPTLGIDFKIAEMTINQNKVQLQIWDSAGQERFRTITRAYYRGSHGIFLCFDLTSQESFDNLNQWLKEINLYAGENTPKILLGNKSDLEDQREISYIDAKNFADSLGFDYFETSAKNATNIQKAFEKLTYIMIRDNILYKST